MKCITSIILLVLLATVYGRSLQNIESLGSRIVNGKVAPNGAFPYIASLRIFGGHSCGGAILNEKWILTAAHCTGYSTTAYVGTNQISKGGVPYPVEKQYVHPDYKDYPTYANDIALMKLEKSIEFNDYVKPIPLPSSEVKDGQEAVLAGWGYTVPGGRTPDDLQYFNVTLKSSETCEKGIPIDLHESQICANGERNQGACHGDSGSPLASNGAVVGVTSRLVVLPCANGYPDIYTDVNLFLDWINEKISDN